MKKRAYLILIFFLLILSSTFINANFVFALTDEEIQDRLDKLCERYRVCDGGSYTPSAPYNLSASIQGNSIRLSWNSVSGVDYYRLKRSTTSGGPYTLLADNITSTYFTDATVVNSITYYYVVTAVSDGSESANSNQVSAKLTNPEIEIISPTPDQIIGLNSSFVPTIKVSDPDNQILTLAYYFDSETTPRETKTISNTATAQTVSFNSINISTLTDGKHTLNFTANDGSYATQAIVSINVDKISPSLGTINFTATENSIEITGSATDSNSGLDPNPYRYTIGSHLSSWISNTSYTLNSLTPNTQYKVKFEARDMAGQIAANEKTIYTKARIPTVIVNKATETSFDISLSDSNPAATQYQILVGNEYVSATGQLTTTPTWITLANKNIIVNGLNSSTSYAIKAKARNQEGIETEFSPTVTKSTLLKPPTDITATVNQTAITVNWNNVAGATGYNLEADGVIVNNITSNSYKHSGLAANTQHTYRVQVISSGGTSSWSQAVTFSTLPEPPAVPTNIQTTAAQTEIVITWDKVASATSYEIEVDGEVVETGSNNTYIHNLLDPLTEHKYRVRARNNGGTSSWSNYIEVITLPYPPSTPTKPIGQATINTVTVTWAIVEGATGYEIEVDGLIIDNGTNTGYLHEGLNPLSGHTYRIRAKNLGGKSSWSEQLDITTLPEKPETPTNIMTTADETTITLTWYQVPNAESYDVEVDGSKITNVKETQFIHNGLSPDSKHSYRIRAVNISGMSEWSSPITIATFPSASDSTLSLTNIIAVVTNRDITISWDTVAFEAEYEIEVDGVLLDNGKDTIYQHSGLQPNQFHTYRIRLKNAEGPSDWVAVLALSTLPDPPDAPGNISSFATNTSIELRWDKVEGATGYDIEVDGEVVEVGNEETYNDVDLMPGTTHTYRVRAKNETGVTAWSPAIVETTTTPTYILNIVNGEEFDFTLLASSVQDFSELTFVITYDSSQIEVVDLYNFTPELDTITEGNIPGTNLTVKHTQGRIEITVNKNIIPGTSWSGEIGTITFKSKITGQTSLDFIVE